ncbi:MAG: ABC transporter ATP-binding protein [Chlorobiota bacterium]
MADKKKRNLSIGDAYRIAWSFTEGNRLLLFTSFVLNILFSIFSAVTIALIKPILSFLFEVDDKEAANDTPLEIGFFEEIKDSFFDFFINLITDDSIESTMIRLGVVIIIMFVLKNIFKYLGAVVGNIFNQKVIKKIRDTVFFKVTSLSMDYFNKEKQGTIISKVANDVSLLNNTTVASINGVIRNIIQIVIFLFFLLTISVELTLWAFSTSILSLVFIRFSVKYLKRYASRMQDAMANFTTTLQESIGGIRVLKGLNAKEATDQRFAVDTERYVKSAIKHKKVMALVPAVNEIWAILGLCVVLVVGGQQVLVQKSIKADDLMTFLFMLFALMDPITSLIGAYSKLQQGIVAGERVMSILNEKPTIIDGNVEKNTIEKNLIFDKVTFGYTDSPVLKNVDIELEKGKKIAFVGGSGSGKSTALDLITRFYDPMNGKLLLDGIDVKEIKLEDYRSLFGIVSQENILFNDSIYNNIIYGMEDIDDEKVIEAAKIANAYKFIMKLPDQFDTVIGDRGVTLSGGERQRVAIARALVRNPEILIFDEATSALDVESEKVVQDAIDSSLKDKTAVIVAHRLSTIVGCDTIYMFNNGEIVEKGTHQELLDMGGYYKNLYEIQFENSK